MFKIISDSACDLSKEYVEKNNITIVPISVSFDQETYYKDNRIEITRDEVYQRMVDDKDLFPKTSLPSVDEYEQPFRECAEQGIPVICVTISSVLSGSVNSARMAREDVLEDFPEADIKVYDSQQNTVSQALIIDQIVRMRNAGFTAEQAAEKMPALMESGRIFFTVGSLDYLRMGGRIGKVAVAATSKLGVKPIIIMKDGSIGLGGIGRKRSKLKETILPLVKDYIEEGGGIDNYTVSVGYGYDAEEGAEFMKAVEEYVGVKLYEPTNVAIGIPSAVHTGPYAIGVGVIRNYDKL